MVFAPRQTMLHSIHGSLYTTGEIELLENALDMNFCRALCHIQHPCHFLVAGALGEQGDNFRFTRGKFFTLGLP